MLLLDALVELDADISDRLMDPKSCCIVLVPADAKKLGIADAAAPAKRPTSVAAQLSVAPWVPPLKTCSSTKDDAVGASDKARSSIGAALWSAMLPLPGTRAAVVRCDGCCWVPLRLFDRLCGADMATADEEGPAPPAAAACCETERFDSRTMVEDAEVVAATTPLQNGEPAAPMGLGVAVPDAADSGDTQVDGDSPYPGRATGRCPDIAGAIARSSVPEIRSGCTASAHRMDSLQSVPNRMKRKEERDGCRSGQNC